MTAARVDCGWTLAVAAAASLATAVHLAGAAISGPLVHATWGHLVRDLALTLIVGVAYEAPLGRAWRPLLAAGLVVPWLATRAAGAAGYYGLSGLSHALLAAAVALELSRRRGRARAYVGAIAAALAVKVGYEVVAGAPAFPMDLGPGVHQAPIAHLAGVVVGAIGGLAAGRAAAAPRPPTSRAST